MHTYKIILRKETGKPQIKEDTCQARNNIEAAKIFDERHGPKNIVAGPFKVTS